MQESSADPDPREAPINQRNQSSPPWLAIFLLLLVLFSLGAAIGLQLSSVDSSLKAANWGLAVFTALWVGTASLWGAINPPASHEPELAPLLRDASNVVLTVDGVVLGLIYAFVGSKGPIPLVVKVGSLSLLVGVVFALILYALVAGKVTKPASRDFATGLFSLISTALVYGLLSIVFALVLPN